MTIRLHAASTLDNAIVGISKYMDHHKKINTFDASLIISYIFGGIDKEEALDMIMSYRSGKKVQTASKIKMDDYWRVNK